MTLIKQVLRARSTAPASLATMGVLAVFTAIGCADDSTDNTAGGVQDVGPGGGDSQAGDVSGGADGTGGDSESADTVSTGDGASESEDVATASDVSESADADIPTPKDCSEAPCGNHGTCTDTAESFTCACTDNYTGEICEVCLPSAGCGVPEVLFIADVDVDEVVGLYSVPLGGGEAQNLSGPLVDKGRVVTYAVSGDGHSVVYVADAETDETYELYRVTLGTPGAVKLSGSLVDGGSLLTAFRLTPDGNTATYWANAETAGLTELYSVPVAGGVPVKRSGVPVTGGSASAYQISPDSQRLVYLADQDEDETFELYVSPLAEPGAPKELSGPPVSGGDVQNSFKITSDSARVVYLADQDIDGVDELYSVALAGGAPVKLHAALSSGSGSMLAFDTSPDGQVVAFIGTLPGQTARGVHVVPVDGTAAPKTLMVSGDGGAPVGFSFFVTFSPDAQQLVLVGNDVDSVRHVYSVPAAGGATKKLSPPAYAGAQDLPRLVISPDSKRVVFVSARVEVGRTELFSAPIDGEGAAVRLHVPLKSPEWVEPSFAITPDSQTVVFLSSQDNGGSLRLWSSPIDGSSSATLISGAFATEFGRVVGFSVAPDGVNVAYIASQDAATSRELFVVPIAGGAEPVKLSPPLAQDRGVISARPVLVVP